MRDLKRTASLYFRKTLVLWWSFIPVCIYYGTWLLKRVLVFSFYRIFWNNSLGIIFPWDQQAALMQESMAYLISCNLFCMISEYTALQWWLSICKIIQELNLYHVLFSFQKSCNWHKTLLLLIELSFAS